MNKYVSITALLLLLWNPITLSLLLGSLWLGILLSLIVLVLGLCICQMTSLRVKVWAFNIAALLSIAYHAELLFRELASNKDIPNLYELHGNFYFNRPFLEKEFRTDEYISYYRTNCQGFRIDELSSPHDSIKQCDWLFIGDSFTQGAQVDYDKMFSSLIYRDFADKVIVNAGISGAGLYDELAFYKSIGHKLLPKRVFLQIGVFNDFMNVQERKASFQDYLTETSSLYRYLTFNLFRQDELPLGRWTEPFFINLQDNIDNNILYKPSSEYKEHDKQNFRKCIKEFKDCVEKNGGELVLLLVPCKEQISEDMLNETISVCHLNRNEIDLNAASKFCMGLCHDYGIKLIDVYQDFLSGPFPFFVVDEHLNEKGHELIAQRLRKEYAGENNRIEYMSDGNRNERYPTLLSDSVNILYQSQDKNHYFIKKRFIGSSDDVVIWSSIKELIHPAISSTQNYLIFTEGDQERHETDVVAYNFTKNKSVVINPSGSGAAIPSFNSDGSQIAYATWTSNDTSPYISVYDIQTNKNIYDIRDGYECWRPIFSKDGQSIYYICREHAEDNFIIKAYSVQTKKKSTILSAKYDIWDITLSPSGEYLSFAGKKDGNWDLFLYRFSDGKIKQLTHTIGDEWDPSFGLTDSDLWFAGVFGISNGIYHIRIGQ